MQLSHLGQWPVRIVQTVFASSRKAGSLRCSCPRITCHGLIGTPMASIIRSAIVMGSKVNSLAAKSAAVVDQRLVFLDSHGDNCLDRMELIGGLRGIWCGIWCCMSVVYERCVYK